MRESHAKENVTGNAEISRGIVRWLAQTVLFVLLVGACLFLSSGRLDWVMAWALIGLLVATQGLLAIVLVSNSPELLEERSRMKEGAKRWDRVLAPLVAVFGPLCTCLVAGFDVRYEWTGDIPMLLQFAGLLIAILGSLFSIWAVASNRFFSGVVRIQEERGHTVVADGPYRYVRHPGYVGEIVFLLSGPLILGSLWALLPAFLTVVVIIVRTTLEDRTLRNELAGYQDYIRRVRYRLVPGLW